MIHRDLKPDNVMVGAFGEVQVMDWGLAKVLRRGDSSLPPASARTDALIATIRNRLDFDHTRLGSVLGTPGYMPPEQVRGELDRVDERSDVFALGAILCKILTGQTPYRASTVDALLAWGKNPDVSEALAQLDPASGGRQPPDGVQGGQSPYSSLSIDPELIALTRDCLALDPSDRPANARVVAERMAAYQSGVQERLRTAEVGRAAESARAEEATKTAQAAEARAKAERQARKLQVGLAASLLALTTAGGLGTMYYLQQESARVAKVDRQLGEATTLLDVARQEPENVSRWEAVLTALRQVEPDSRARERLAALSEEAEAGAKAAQRDRRLVDTVAEIRSNKYELGHTGADEAYQRAFQDAGIDLEKLGPGEAGVMLKSRPAAVALAAAAALDDWALSRRAERPKDDRWKWPIETARAADPDPFRDQVRAAILEPDEAKRNDRLARLAANDQATNLPPASAVLLAMSLSEHESAVALIRAAASRHPDDLWVNYTLADRLGWLRPVPREEQVRYYSAARAIHPTSAHHLAHLFEEMDRGDEALAVFADLVTRRPEDIQSSTCYGSLLKRTGRPESGEILRRAVNAAREEIRSRPDDAVTHNNLGNALRNLGKPEEAIAEYHKALLIRPDLAEAHNNLGSALWDPGKPEEAIAEYHKALLIRPDYAEAHEGLGDALLKQGNLDEAIAEYREAIRIRPDYAEAYCNLGHLMRGQGDYAESLAALRRGHVLGSTRPDWQYPSSQWVEQAERMAAFADRIPALLRGDDAPRDNADRLALAEVCYGTKRYGIAAQLWCEALEQDPVLCNDRQAQHRYNAACVAALAASAASHGEPAIDEDSKAKLRAQALDWLKAEREAWSKLMESRDPSLLASISRTLKHWQADPDLASVRDPDALAKLPESERAAWEALWNEVERLRSLADSREER